jgi:hypothetical protein
MKRLVKISMRALSRSRRRDVVRGGGNCGPPEAPAAAGMMAREVRHARHRVRGRFTHGIVPGRGDRSGIGIHESWERTSE